MNGGIGRDAALSRKLSGSAQRANPTSMCAGSAEWNSHMRSQLQEELVAKKREDASLEDQLLLLEHEPVYTIGRTPDRSSLSRIRAARICRIRSFRSTAAGKRRITGRAN